MAESSTAQGALDRLASFRVVYLGIFAYVVLAVGTFQLTERLLQRHFARELARAVAVSPAAGPVVPQIQARVQKLVHESIWTRLGGVEVRPLVLGADARTPIYLEGRTVPPPPLEDALSPFQEANSLLPAIATIGVRLPVDSLLSGVIWVSFGALIVPLLFLHSRRLARREEAVFSAAQAARDAAAERARSIQGELEKIRGRLAAVEPAERAHGEEIASLQTERAELQARLRELQAREDGLRESATRSHQLERDQQALEDLLEEAVQDLDQKETEIRELQERLRRASKALPPRPRERAGEQIARRLHTLYRNLEIDDRAVDDMADLGDESLRLRAEECLKRLDDDRDSATVRRKVGGLPGHLSIFELGFAGKGRIYYARGRQRPYRILAVGGKASQKTDLEYLSRISLD
jgi:hypothetical protein